MYQIGGNDDSGLQDEGETTDSGLGSSSTPAATAHARGRALAHSWMQRRLPQSVAPQAGGGASRNPSHIQRYLEEQGAQPDS